MVWVIMTLLNWHVAYSPPEASRNIVFFFRAVEICRSDVSFRETTVYILALKHINNLLYPPCKTERS